MKIFAAQGDRSHKTELSSFNPPHRKNNRIVLLLKHLSISATVLLVAGFLLPSVPSVFATATAVAPNRAPNRLAARLPEQVVRAVVEEVVGVSDNALESTGGEGVVIGPGHTVAAYN